MTFLAPIFFYIGLGVAAGAVALHFIVTRHPASSPFPTARFVPERSVRVTALAKVPEDLLVLLIRVLLATAIGAAFARPVLTPDRRPVARVVLADVSGDVGSIVELRDSARSLLESGDVLVAFDSTARLIRDGAADSASRLMLGDARGRISPALITAMRAASVLRDAADSVEIVIVSALRASEVDGATQPIRALWPGRIRLVRVAAVADSLVPQPGFLVSGVAGDPLVVAALASGVAARDSAVRIVRGAATPSDSVWAAGGRRTLVRWPAADAPPGWVERGAPDTAAAVAAGEAALVYPLERRWRLDSTTRVTRVAARWVDGEPAAIDRAVGEGCVRDVAIPIPARGDLVLRPAFARFLAALGAPCGVIAGGGPALDDARVNELAGEGPLAARADIAPPEVMATPFVPWLVAAALLLALLELLVRRGGMRLSSKLPGESDSRTRSEAAA
ncbi:MAG TPA: BatA domain-containing protein [Gemmatimonadaceae bacterium]|nr:BatA domain-containing protein [Gemmatimonadaceae bacterium]